MGRGGEGQGSSGELFRRKRTFANGGDQPGAAVRRLSRNRTIDTSSIRACRWITVHCRLHRRAWLRTLLSTVARRHTCAVKKRDFLQVDDFATQPGRGIRSGWFSTLGALIPLACRPSRPGSICLRQLSYLPRPHAVPTIACASSRRARNCPLQGDPSVGTAHAVLDRVLSRHTRGAWYGNARRGCCR